MADLEAIKQSARIVYDEQGMPVVQLPLEQWNELWADFEPAQPSQIERIQALIKQLQNEPDDTPPEWWDEFRQFLRENRMNFAPRDLHDNDK